MGYLFSIGGIIASFFLIKYRERVGEMIGEAEWMGKIGGVYNLVIFIAIFIFLWSLAWLTGTLDVLFSPVLYLLPGVGNGGQAVVQ